MVRREAVVADGNAVLARGIALILAPPIVWKLLRKTHHILVAVGLGKHRGRSDIGILTVTLDYRAPRDI